MSVSTGCSYILLYIRGIIVRHNTDAWNWLYFLGCCCQAYFFKNATAFCVRVPGPFTQWIWYPIHHLRIIVKYEINMKFPFLQFWVYSLNFQSGMRRNHALNIFNIYFFAEFSRTRKGTMRQQKTRCSCVTPGEVSRQSGAECPTNMAHIGDYLLRVWEFLHNFGPQCFRLKVSKEKSTKNCFLWWRTCWK